MKFEFDKNVHANRKAVVPERMFPHILSTMGESDDASINDAENEISRTEFDSHANMVVVGKNSYIIAVSGRTAKVQAYSPSYNPQIIPILDAAVLYECRGPSAFPTKRRWRKMREPASNCLKIDVAQRSEEGLDSRCSLFLVEYS